MMDSGIKPVYSVNNNSDTGMGNNWIWVILILMFLGGGNALGANRGMEANSATNMVNNDFLYTQSKIDSLSQAIISQTNALNQTMNSGFNGVNMGLCNVGHQIDSGFCSVNRNIDSVRYDMSKNTCDIINAIGQSTQTIIGLINSNTVQELRDRNAELSTALNNCNQTAAFNAAINNALATRFPYPVPANVVGQGYPGFAPAYGGNPCNPCAA